MKYEIINKRDGEIIEADTLKDIVEYMEEYGLTDDEICIGPMKVVNIHSGKEIMRILDDGVNTRLPEHNYSYYENGTRVISICERLITYLGSDYVIQY